jgi:hypothetical protein
MISMHGAVCRLAVRVLSVIGVAGLAAIVPAQSPTPRPQFDVVSVKPNTGGERGVQIGAPSPGRFHAENVWLRFLVQVAWNVKDYQVSGGPGWAASDRYDIEATTVTKASFEQMRLMLQTLLEDRFQLVLHRDSKEAPVYELVLARARRTRPQRSRRPTSTTSISRRSPHGWGNGPLPRDASLACWRPVVSGGHTSAPAGGRMAPRRGIRVCSLA